MTQSASQPSLESVAVRLDRVDQMMMSYNRKVRSRNWLVGLFLLLTIVFCCFYLSYAYKRYGNEVTPDLVASNAQAVFENQLPGARLQLESNLKTNAPQYVGKMLDELETVPGNYADQLNQQTATAMDAAMPQVGEELYASMKRALDDATKAKVDGTDEQRFQGTLAAMAQVYSDETVKFVNQAHDTYAKQSVDFTKYLSHLASDANLDRREQLHRDMFRNMLMLMREHAKDSGNPDQLKLNVLSPS